MANTSGPRALSTRRAVVAVVATLVVAGGGLAGSASLANAAPNQTAGLQLMMCYYFRWLC